LNLKETISDLIREQIGIYQDYENLSKREINILRGDNLNSLLGIMKKKAILIKNLDNLSLHLEAMRENDRKQNNMLSTDIELKNLVNNAISRVELVQQLENKIKNVTEKESDELEKKLLNIRSNDEVLVKYSGQYPDTNARFIDVKMNFQIHFLKFLCGFAKVGVSDLSCVNDQS